MQLVIIIRSVVIAAATMWAINSGSTAKAAASVCDADVGNLVQNCGFEGGTYTDSYGNAGVPNDWAVVGDWASGDGISGGAYVHSGTYSLSLSGPGYQPVVGGVTQTVSDASGATYNLSFWFGADASRLPGGVAFDVYWDGTLLLSEDEIINGTNPTTFTQFSYSVVGTGSDTLTFEGYIPARPLAATKPIPDPAYLGWT